ncbi:MAG: phosphatase [Clostridia bacterium]|nr:phosphatase [Clostridia bacterium]
MSKLKIELDTHTHTVLSGHAYGTLKENAQAARDIGLKGFVCADHGPEIPGAAPAFTLTAVLDGLPDYIEDVRLVKGAEANIMDEGGALDLEMPYIGAAEFVIASLHTISFPPKDEQANTAAVLGALENPHVDAVGHPGNPKYPLDYKALVRMSGELGKPVEINNHSFKYRRGSEPNCRRIIRLCREQGVPIIVSSDAHSSYGVGHFERALAVLEDEEFPQELILNGDFDRFMDYLAARRTRTGN